MGIGQGLEQYTVDDAEDDGVGADGDGEREQGNGREQGCAAEPADDLLELIAEQCHGLRLRAG